MDIKPISVNRTYSLTMEHISKVIEMALSTGQSQGQIVREAIDLLYEAKKFSERIENPTEKFLIELKKKNSISNSIKGH